MPNNLCIFIRVIGSKGRLTLCTEHYLLWDLIRRKKLVNLHDFIQESLDFGYDTLIDENGLRLSGGGKYKGLVLREPSIGPHQICGYTYEIENRNISLFCDQLI